MKNKGRIEVGADADLVLVDMNLKQTICNEQQQTKSRWSPWDGSELQGWPVATWVMGRKVFQIEDGQNSSDNCKFDETQCGQEIVFESPVA